MADIHFSDLATIGAILGNEIVPIENATTTMKITANGLKEHVIGDTNISTIGDGTVTGAISATSTDAKVLIITVSSVSALPQTVTDSKITADMVCIHSEFSSASASVSATVTTSVGSLTISGTISGTTDITLYLMKSRS